MNKKCLCQHDFNYHIRGSIKEMMYTSGFTLESVEIRFNWKNVTVLDISLNVLGQINFGMGMNNLNQKLKRFIFKNWSQI